jgi:hypothetical protein
MRLARCIGFALTSQRNRFCPLKEQRTARTESNATSFLIGFAGYLAKAACPLPLKSYLTAFGRMATTLRMMER